MKIPTIDKGKLLGYAYLGFFGAIMIYLPVNAYMERSEEMEEERQYRLEDVRMNTFLVDIENDGKIDGYIYITPNSLEFSVTKDYVGKVGKIDHVISKSELENRISVKYGK